MGRGFSTIFTFKTLAKYFQVQTVPSGIFRFFSAAAKNGNYSGILNILLSID